MINFKIDTLSTVNNPNSVHGIYPYRGKISAIDAEQILSQMPKGSTVLDPFCGSGTIIYEGLKYGLHTIGIDANPLAVLLSNAKIHIPDNFDVIDEEISFLINTAENVKDYPNPPDYSASLFHKDSLVEILKMSTLFESMSDYVKACFIGTIALTARGCNHYKWTSSTVGKNMEVKRYIPFYEKFIYKAKKHFFPLKNNSVVYYNDTRKANQFIDKNSIDFIFSSPPYFDCLDYTAYYAKIIYEILSYDRIQIKKTLIQDFTNYKEDMKIVLQSLYDILKPKGQIIFVVGDKKIHGKVINGADFFNEISPFRHVETIERFYSGTSSQVFDQLNKTTRKEQIIIWQK